MNSAKKQRKTTEGERLASSSRKLEYQRNISSKDGYNKGKICKDFIEAEEIKKRRQEYTEELFKKRS